MLTALQSLESQRAWQPNREDCQHNACYCEENVYHLCKVLAEKVPEDNLYAVFISNPAQKASVWLGTYSHVQPWPECSNQFV